MDILLSILAIILLLIGLIGAIVPALPGPIISYAGLVSLYFSSHQPFTDRFMLIWAAIAVSITVLDNVVPILGTKKLGGSKKGIWGSIIGLLFGILFLGPFGILIGPFVGAVLGELIGGKEFNFALKAGFGSFLGFLTGTILKLVFSVWAGYYIVMNLYFFS
ncbi:MAG: DUF456 domain-containing protein [Bacteroidales bacterium]|jgi:uncharacterized protein YqgC (DUF456 family)|nr:DUF456 domain-containing protein [Bacteroidales bacterium]